MRRVAVGPVGTGAAPATRSPAALAPGARPRGGELWGQCALLWCGEQDALPGRGVRERVRPPEGVLRGAGRERTAGGQSRRVSLDRVTFFIFFCGPGTEHLTLTPRDDATPLRADREGCLCSLHRGKLKCSHTHPLPTETQASHSRAPSQPRNAAAAPGAAAGRLFNLPNRPAAATAPPARRQPRHPRLCPRLRPPLLPSLRHHPHHRGRRRRRRRR